MDLEASEAIQVYGGGIYVGMNSEQMDKLPESFFRSGGCSQQHGKQESGAGIQFPNANESLILAGRSSLPGRNELLWSTHNIQAFRVRAVSFPYRDPGLLHHFIRSLFASAGRFTSLQANARPTSSVHAGSSPVLPINLIVSGLAIRENTI